MENKEKINAIEAELEALQQETPRADDRRNDTAATAAMPVSLVCFAHLHSNSSHLSHHTFSLIKMLTGKRCRTKRRRLRLAHQLRSFRVGL